MSLHKAILESLLPPGLLWEVEQGEGLDNLLDGLAASLDATVADMAALSVVRDPQRTQILADLEREYGVGVAAGSSESARRAHLSAFKAATNGDGGRDFLQRVLDAAGFTVRVHVNNPPVDPGSFVLYAAGSTFGNSTAQFGVSSMGAKRGELLANGEVYRDQAKVAYSVPANEGYWSMVFFVGGAATRNGLGELTSIADAEVPAERRAELRRLILKCKPMSTWAGLLINYV